MPPTLTSRRQGLAPVLAVHVALLVAGAVALSLDSPAKGWAVLACVVGYVVGLLLACRAADERDLLALAGWRLTA